MTPLSRETLAALVAAGYGVLPSLVWQRQDAAAWALSEAIREAETALTEDDRAENVVNSDCTRSS